MKHPNDDDDSDTDAKPKSPLAVLSGGTPIQVKFIGWLVIVCAGGFGGWIWWAASMSTKLDVVITNQSTQLMATKSLAEDMSRLKEWRIQVDTVGSPIMVKRVDEIDKELREIVKQFELHKVTTMNKQP